MSILLTALEVMSAVLAAGAIGWSIQLVVHVL
jgi:hypothetical protein